MLPGTPFPEGRSTPALGPMATHGARKVLGSQAAGPGQAGEETGSDEAGPTISPHEPQLRGTDKKGFCPASLRMGALQGRQPEPGVQPHKQASLEQKGAALGGARPFLSQVGAQGTTGLGCGVSNEQIS